MGKTKRSRLKGANSQKKEGMLRVRMKKMEIRVICVSQASQVFARDGALLFKVLAPEQLAVCKR